MSELAVRIDGLGKKYRVRHQRAGYTALRDVIAEKVGNLFTRNATTSNSTYEDFWALKDVSFEIRRGEAIGVIGRNGAGKSTLLKILSQITEPSAGRIELDGRVASLLEVGTGFHPELTGRENIYLNGAILGMSRAEIRRKFDEIVAFAEVERFLDTPVKHFSSGMYVRLAFGVAAHLETEILIVDEVLAVGDVEFQKKCLGKMSEVAQGGRTVLFVSHNMGAIRRLTERCILLEKGRVRADTSSQEAIDLYVKESGAGWANGTFVRPASRPADAPFFVERVTTRPSLDEGPVSTFDCDQPIVICIDYNATRRVHGLYAYMTLTRADGTVVYEGDSRDIRVNPFDSMGAGQSRLVVKIPPRILGPGTYQIYLSFSSVSDSYGNQIDSPGIVGEFHLDDTATPRGNHRNGYLSTILDWSLRPVSNDTRELIDQ